MTTTAEAKVPPFLGMPPRPARPVSLVQLMRAGRANWLAACDDVLFDELLVERRLLWRRCFIISDPEGIRRVLQDNYENYPRCNPLRRIFEFETATGMLCAEDETWRRHRRLLNPTLDHRALLSDLPMLGDLAEAMAEHLSDLPTGQEIDLGQTMLMWMMASSSRLIAGDDRELDQIVDRMGYYPKRASALHFLRFPKWLSFLERRRSGAAEARKLQPLLDRLIAERREENYRGRKDLLWRMAHAHDPNDGGGLNNAELCDELLTLAAPSRTTLRPLIWLWCLLAQYPAVEARLHAELDRVLGGRSPTAEDLPKLVYLRRVLDETMRVYPPVPVFIPRVAKADDELCGRRIPRKSLVMILPWVLHRHRRLWPDPERFDPERFSPQQIAARSRYSYLPFSVGPHFCIGAPMAMMQIVTAITVFAQRFRFRPVIGPPIEPKGWIHLSPNRPVLMTVEPRIAAPAAAAQ